MIQNKQLEKISSGGIRYLLYLPVDYGFHKLTPLLLFLHGSGERGNDLSLLKSYGPPGIVEKHKDLPFIIVSPQCAYDDYWKSDLLNNFLNEVINDHHVDKNRIYLSGVSMGAYGAFDLAMHHPEMFAAIIPICGGGNMDLLYKIKNIPTWIFHGAKDNIVPVTESIHIVEKLRSLGSDVKLTIYPNAAHDSWTETFDNPEIYDWLLEQHK